MRSDRAADTPRRVHIRHTVAGWLGARSIVGRTSWLVALIVAVVVSAVAWLEVWSFVSSIDEELTAAAKQTSQAVADSLGRTKTSDLSEVRSLLHNFAEAEPAVHAISLIGPRTDGDLGILASTSTEEREDVLVLASHASATHAQASERTDAVISSATAVPGRDQEAVVVTVGLESLQHARAHGFSIAFGFALPTLLLVTALTYIGLRRVLQRPLAAIVATMERAAEGDTAARAPAGGDDELGTVSAGLNEMLDQLGKFNDLLRERVRAATSDLAERNADLAESYAQVSALRETLGRSERLAALGQMAAVVAHQAGTPLNLVSGYVQMLRDDPGTPEKTRTRLMAIDRQIQQVIRVLRGMLDRARRPSGFSTTDVPRIVEGVREIAAPGLARAGTHLHLDIDDALPPIHADTMQIEMALLHLVANAREAMGRGGEIVIAARRIPTGVRLEVSDTGPGVPEALLDRMFEPWVTTKTAGEGTGLGLAIVRDVVRAHGGSVSAYNRSRGAVFVIDLPDAASTSAAVAHA